MSTLSFGFERFYKKYVPFVDDCGYFITDCFIFHKQNTTLKFNSQFFSFKDWEKKSVFLRAWTWDCFYSQKSQRLSLMYHSRTWFQSLRYNYDHTLLLLYTYIACTFIVPWRGCHCSSDICQKPDWITLWPCHMSASHAQVHPHVASLF